MRTIGFEKVCRLISHTGGPARAGLFRRSSISRKHRFPACVFGLGVSLFIASNLPPAEAQETETSQTGTPVQDLRGSSGSAPAIQPTPTPVNVRALLAENQALRHQMSDLIQSGAETETLRKQNETLKQEITKLAAKVLELDQVKAKAMSAKKELETLAGLRDRLKTVEDENRSLRVQLAGLIQTASDLAEARQRIAQLEESVKNLSEEKETLLALKEENRKLMETIADLESQVADRVKAESETERLRQQVASLEMEKATLIQETQTQSRFLKRQVEALKLKNEAFKEAEKNRKDLLEQVRQLQKRTEILERNNEEIARLKEELNRLRADRTQPDESTVSVPPPSPNHPPVSETVNTPAASPTTNTAPSVLPDVNGEDGEEGFSRYEPDSDREALEQRIREELRRRREKEGNPSPPDR